jgi:hypothetical protein
MSKKPNTRPHSPPTLAPCRRRVDSTHSPRPLYKRGGRVSVCLPSKTSGSKNEKGGEWPPSDLRLPDTVEAIEAGRADQQQLLPDPIDDSREGRLARLLSGPNMRGKRQ